MHIGFRILEQFTRGGTGRALLSTHKDRPGFLPRPTIGRLVLNSDGEAVTYSLEADHSHDGDIFRPTVLMERISEKLEGELAPVSLRWIEENVTGKGPALRAAVDVLVNEGYLERDKGPNGYEITSARRYRESADEGASPVRPGASRCVPEPAVRVLVLVPPYRDEHSGRAEVRPRGASRPSVERASAHRRGRLPRARLRRLQGRAHDRERMAVDRPCPPLRRREGRAGVSEIEHDAIAFVAAFILDEAELAVRIAREHRDEVASFAAAVADVSLIAGAGSMSCVDEVILDWLEALALSQRRQELRDMTGGVS